MSYLFEYEHLLKIIVNNLYLKKKRREVNYQYMSIDKLGSFSITIRCKMRLISYILILQTDFFVVELSYKEVLMIDIFNLSYTYILF